MSRLHSPRTSSSGQFACRSGISQFQEGKAGDNRCRRSGGSLRGVVDTSVLLAGVAGMKTSVHKSNVASAKFVQRWVEQRTFVWLISDEILEEYREVLARLGARRPLIGKIVNTLRAKGEHVKPGPTRNLSPDPDDNYL